MSNEISRRRFLNCLGTVPLYLSLQMSARANADDSGQALQQWNAMPPEQQAELQKRWTEFKALSPEQREKLRQAQKRFAALPAPEQEKIKRNFARWQGFTPEKKEKLRRHFAHWQTLDPKRKRRFSSAMNSGAPFRRKNAESSAIMRNRAWRGRPLFNFFFSE